MFLICSHCILHDLLQLWQAQRIFSQCFCTSWWGGCLGHPSIVIGNLTSGLQWPWIELSPRSIPLMSSTSGSYHRSWHLWSNTFEDWFLQDQLQRAIVLLYGVLLSQKKYSLYWLDPLGCWSQFNLTEQNLCRTAMDCNSGHRCTEDFYVTGVSNVVNTGIKCERVGNLSQYNHFRWMYWRLLWNWRLLWKLVWNWYGILWNWYPSVNKGPTGITLEWIWYWMSCRTMWNLLYKIFSTMCIKIWKCAK